MIRFMPLKRVLVASVIALGCGTPAPTVDDAPFRAAIGEYLRANNMAMKIKEIKRAPVIAGDSANLTASLTHEQLGGPSVTWKIQFARQNDGSWHAVSYHD